MTYEAVQPVLDWIRDHPNWAGFVVFLISLSESLAIVGLVVPGVVMMTAIGAMMGSGILPFWLTLLWAILGAIAGDGISYWLGYHYHEHLRDFWPFKQFPKLLARGEKFFKEHGGKSIIFGRFVGPVRPMIPVIAGMMDMTPKRFLFFNIVSAIAWAPLYSLPGILIGASLGTLSPEVARRVVLFILIILLILWVTYAFLLKLGIWLGKIITHNLNRVWTHWQSSHRLIWLHKTLRTAQGTEEGQLGTAVLFLLSLLIFCYTTYCVIESIGIASWNEPVYQILRALYIDKVVNGMFLLTGLGDATVVLPAALAVGLWFLWKKRYFDLFCWLGTIFVGETLGILIREWIAMARPEGLVHMAKEYAFPSGHALTATLVYGLAAAFIHPGLSKPHRYIPWVIAILLILSVSFSRLYLGAHWFTDVVGGISLGVACVAMGVLIFRRFESRVPVLRDILLPGLLVLACTFSVYAFHTVPKKRLALTRHWPVQNLSANHWWESENTLHPLYRTGAFKRIATIFDVEWLGSLPKIESALAKAGFKAAPEKNYQNWLQLLSSNVKPDVLPVLPKFHRDRLPVLVMIKPVNPTERYVVQIWRSDFVDEKNRSLWVGTIRKETAKNPLPMVTVFTELDHTDQDLNEFLQILKNQPSLKYKVVMPQSDLINERHKILLIKE